MGYINLGKTGLKVSRICLGCMTYGEPATGEPKPGRHAWALNEEESQPFLREALDFGINFFDTANVYSSGASEEVLGRFLKANMRREAVVIATKVHGAMREEPNGRGLSRKAIFYELDESLRRLRTDYVDLYQIHRWDYETPIEETLDALHDLVKAGKVRYLGASSMFVWQFTKALYLADLHGWSRFVSMQNHYNLLYREEEREMIPLCQSEGIGVIPWSPLARGRLARPWQSESTERFETDRFGAKMYSQTEGADRKVVDRVGQLAEQRGVARAQLALARSFEATPSPGRRGGALAAARAGRDCLSGRAIHAASRPRFQLSAKTSVCMRHALPKSSVTGTCALRHSELYEG